MKNGTILILLLFLLITSLSSSMVSCAKIQKESGLYLEIHVKPTEQGKESCTSGELASIKTVMEKRFDALGIWEYTISYREKEQMLFIKIHNYDDLEQIQYIISKPGELKFTDESGKSILEGKNLKSATFLMEPLSGSNLGEPTVYLQFDEEGTRLFAEGTKANIGKSISIYLDEVLLMTPSVNETIEDGKASITFGRDTKESVQVAREVAALLQGGIIRATIEITKAEKNHSF